ncbi:class E sortase [Solirubrobacter soli]|uniref:class E sortase n=1 Tax=Solirubrobacter soli TaxID=363832 RepID=UPI00042893B3|nr:class E sortase [Solirubrobacter soli]
MTAKTATRSRVRSALRLLSTLLIVSGSLLLADAAATLVWEEPVSSLYAHYQQSDLEGELDRLDKVKPTPVEVQALKKLPDPTRRLAFAARSLDRKTHEGDAVGKIQIPRIGLNTVFVEGTNAGDLRKGPGHYPATPLPGQHGTVAIAGHRTTYGAPFRKIDKVKPGDQITVVMPYGRFTYRVERTRIVPPTAVWVTQRVSYDRLILSACHPLYSAAKRIVVFARLIRSAPRGAAA